jgi:hypothetical protein
MTSTPTRPYMALLDAELANLPSDAERIEAIRAHAHHHGAIIGISHRFSLPGHYWADMIAPGHATIATARTPFAAAHKALTQFTETLPTASR